MKFSQAQLGSFISLYYKTFSKKPKFLKEKLIKLRNDVVHNGKIVNSGECHEYARGVYDIISSVILELKIKFKNKIHKISSYRLESIKKSLNKDIEFKTAGISTGFIRFKLMSFEELLDRNKEENELFENKLYPVNIIRPDGYFD